MSILPEPPFLTNIGFVLTYKCTIACPHCIVEAGPHRKEETPLEQALAWIEQAGAYRGRHIQGLALTGGEPFYNLQNLVQISNHARSLGFLVSVVTNGFWAPTRDAALSVLAQVPAIQMISVSTDIYHQRAIPFENVRNVVWAAGELGRLYNIAVCTDHEEEPGYRKIIEDLTAMGEADRIRPSITFPVGRAQKQARHFQYRMAPEPTVAACTMAGSPVVFPDGAVIGCIGPMITLPPGHPLYLGNLKQESLARILDRAEENPILHAIRVFGPHKLVEWLRENGCDALLPEEYIVNCICDTCYKLMSGRRLVDALQGIVQQEPIRQAIAYGRVYYLHETAMAERMHRGTPGG